MHELEPYHVEGHLVGYTRREGRGCAAYISSSFALIKVSSSSFRTKELARAVIQTVVGNPDAFCIMNKFGMSFEVDGEVLKLGGLNELRNRLLKAEADQVKESMGQ